jgi:4-hydroxythreonine-4-phosphate dehydrogenase
MGDPAGVGPETIVGAWGNPSLHAACRAVVAGHPQVLQRAARLLGSSCEVVEVTAPDLIASDARTLPCLRCVAQSATEVEPASHDPAGGRAACDAVAFATQLALEHQVDGITTAPLNKSSLAAAGYGCPGHTELLARLCGVSDVAMMLYLLPGGRVSGPGGLGVVHVTLHMALREIFPHLTPPAILSRARLADAVMREFLRDGAHARPPRIGVCALNPHAGEQGLFGDEELTCIRPAVEHGVGEGLNLVGPLPADTLMGRAVAGEFDAVVAMYHDQGHIALKVVDMYRAVNITLGLPIVRTSVAHGTAFDLAWQGRAESAGMVTAVRTCALLARQRRPQHLQATPVSTT